MKNYYKFFVFMVIVFLMLTTINTIIVKKDQITNLELRDISKTEKQISIIYTHYKQLESFINQEKITPISKEDAHKKMLILLEKLKREYSVKITENYISKNQIFAKISYEDMITSKERLKKFFEILFRTDNSIIVSIDFFKLDVIPEGTQIKSIVSLYIPFKEEGK